ncbi:MAG: glycine-rich domain-containing protein [Candidatus Paceibacterota bacterium]|jgi:hypothetical protein
MWFNNKLIKIFFITFALLFVVMFFSNNIAFASCASGGGLTCTETMDGLYTINKYTGSGTYTWTRPAGVTSVQYLVVGGGGGGGGNGGGGGGGGGFLTGTYSVSGNITVTVGAGGTVAGATTGTNGGNSQFGTIVASGGGGGVSRDGNTPGALVGGSGGAGAGASFSNGKNGAAGISGQGYAGGNGTSDGGTSSAGGGGGGAGGNGATASYNVGGNGGVGKSSTITGSTVYYAGGGGGGETDPNSTTGGIGGNGGGGGGARPYGSNLAVNGTGGGGGGNYGRGATGVVIVRFLVPVDGVCGATINTCVAGTFSDTPADTSTNYQWTCLGINGGANSSTCTIAKAYCTSAGPDAANIDTDTHEIYVYGVGNASSVNVPTWTDAGGQDDLVWHTATDLGGGTWKTTIDFTTTHNNETGIYYAHAYVYDSVGAVLCDTANFTRYIDGVCGTTINTCVAGTFSDTPADTSTDYQWTCLGIDGGASPVCMIAVPTPAAVIDSNGSAWIQVPASSYVDNPFYIMQYNPKKVLQGASYIPVSTTTGTIYNNVTKQEAVNACQTVGGHLMTNNEWMAVARNLENVASNWTGGSVGSGAIKQGNAGWDSAGTYNLGGIDSTASNSKARLTLSNGENIWHFSGNIEQFVDQTISKDAVPLPSGGKEFQSVTDWGSTSYSEAGPANTSFTTTQGVGNVANLARGESPWDDPTSDTFTLARGGWWGYGPGSGIFNWWLYASGNVANSSIGFRCVSDADIGVCGSADGEMFLTEPTTNLCVGDGIASSVTETTTWNWTCSSNFFNSWYDEDWTKRKVITISNSGSTLTDYQIKIDADIYNETGLAGSWHMNEASGTVTADSSGNAKNATVTGATVVAGKFGNARSFAASSDTMLISPTISLASTDYTIET